MAKERISEKLIQGYLWQEIIRLGFSPMGVREQKRWIHLYLKSLKDFLELSGHPKSPKIIEEKQNIIIFNSYSFTLNFPLDTNLDISITEIGKFVTAFISKSEKGKDIWWIHDVDGNYFTFPIQDFLNCYKRRKEILKTIRESDIEQDIETVLKGLIFHPATHQHILSPIDDHKIRIGGGIYNAFLYLFHLRYQFCPSIKKKEAEEKRLIKLFKESIKQDSLSVDRLMALPETDI